MTPSEQKPRVAFVTSGLYFDQESEIDRYELMSARCAGEIFCVHWGTNRHDAKIGSYRVRALSLPERLAGYGVLRSVFRSSAYMAFVVAAMVKERFRGGPRFSLIVGFDPLKSGCLAWLGSKIIGVPFAVELNGNYEAAMSLPDAAAVSWFSRSKARFARKLIPWILERASGIKLLYESQIDVAQRSRWSAKTRTFHSLTDIRHSKFEPSEERYILLIGYPWYLKGVDVLIEAFLEIAPEFPDCHLRVVGYCPAPDAFVALARGHRRIHLQPRGVPHAEAISLINRCEIFVLPSRTEAMGRVLLEAMAARKPVIGARVDGIPRVIEHGRTGLLFEKESASDLAAQLRTLLNDPELAARLGSQGQYSATHRFSRESYEEQYFEFVQMAAGGSRAPA